MSFGQFYINFSFSYNECADMMGIPKGTVYDWTFVVKKEFLFMRVYPI